MQRAKRWIVTAAACLLMLGAGDGRAQDWPQWRGAARDGKVTGFTAPQSWPTELKRQWSVTVGTGDATPALVGDRMYLFTRQGNEEVTLCLNAADGKEIWRDQYPAQAVTGAGAGHPGPRCSPTVADGKVVTLGVGGVLSCLNAATGALAWRDEEFSGMVPRFFTSSSPIVIDGKCIAQLGDANDGAVVAYDLAAGSLKWKWSGEGPAYSSPALMTVDGTRQVVVMTDKSIVGLAVADGAELWKIPFPLAGRGYNSASPIVDGTTLYYTGSLRGTKAVKIEKQGEGFAVKPLWDNPQLGTQFNTPVLAGGLLFGLSERGNFYCMNAADGKVAWTDTERPGQYCGMLNADSVLLALPERSEMIVFKPTAEKYDVVARFKVAETPTFAHPVIAGKRIYIKDEQALTLWTLE